MLKQTHFGVLFSILFIVLVTGCGNESGSSGTLATETSKETGETTKVETDQTPTKIPAPSSGKTYFGELPYNQLNGPFETASQKNNSVILLVFDALNVKHLSAYGYQRPTSPNIDALAKKGLVLTNYVSNSSWTRPSYTTIVTGLPKSKHGVELEGGWRLDPEIKTLAERFRSAGYRTAGFTGNPLVRKSWGFDQGFQTYEDPATLDRKAFFPDSVLVDMAQKWMGQNRERPFFLVLFLTAPHTPYRPPQKPRTFLSQVSQGKIIEHPFKEYKNPLKQEDHEKTVAAYDDEIAYMDRQVGKIVAYLEKTNRAQNTVIAMTADHGEVFGNHNCYTHTYHMWEPALRVPFILTLPGQKQVGVSDDRPFTHVDIAPTLLGLVDIPYSKEELTGLSITETLRSPDASQDRTLFSQYNAHGIRRQAIRKGEFKLVHHHKVEKRAEKSLNELESHVKQANPKDLPTLAWDNERYELYNLINDPQELADIFSTNKESPELVELMNTLQKHIGGPIKAGELTEEMIKALENAGYLQKKKF